MSRSKALPESEEAIRATIRAAEAAVMAGAARERERRVHRWECARCHIAQETPKAPEVAPDGCVYCPRCAEAIRPYAATPQQLAGIDDVSPREAMAAAKRAAEERLKAILADPRVVIVTDFNEPEKAEAERIRSDTPAPPKDVQTDTEETKAMPKKQLGGARPLAEPWRCPTPGCGRTMPTAQAVGAHKRWCPRKSAPKPAPKSAPAAADPVLATVSVPRGEGKPSKRIALELDPPAAPPARPLWPGGHAKEPDDGPPGAIAAAPAARGPIARFAGVEVELATVEEAVAFVRAMQTSGQQSAAGSVSAKG